MDQNKDNILDEEGNKRDETMSKKETISNIANGNDNDNVNIIKTNISNTLIMRDSELNAIPDKTNIMTIYNENETINKEEFEIAKNAVTKTSDLNVNNVDSNDNKTTPESFNEAIQIQSTENNTQNEIKLPEQVPTDVLVSVCEKNAKNYIDRSLHFENKIQTTPKTCKPCEKPDLIIKKSNKCLKEEKVLGVFHNQQVRCSTDDLTQFTTLTETNKSNQLSVNDESTGLSNETENVAADSVIGEKTQTEVIQENSETTICSDKAVVDDSVTQSVISDECQIIDQIANDNVTVDSNGSSENTASDVANENEASKEILSEETSSTTLCGNNQEPDELTQLTTLTEPETKFDIPNQTPIKDESSGLSNETENVAADSVIEEQTQTEVVQENPETTICSDKAVVDDSVTQSVISDECQITDQIANDNVTVDSNGSSENTASDVVNENQTSKEILSEETSSTTLFGNNQEPDELIQLTTLTEPETQSDIPNQTSINDQSTGLSNETENVVADSVIGEKTQTEVVQENPETTVCSDNAIVDDSVTQSMISDECQITDQIANDNVPIDSSGSSENTASDVVNENQTSKEILSEETSSKTLCGNNQEPNELTQFTTLTEPEPETPSDIPNQTPINYESSGLSTEIENVVAASVIGEKTQTEVIQENSETTICSDKAVVDDSVTQSVISDECQITDQIANDNVTVDSNGSSENTASDVVNENQTSKEILSKEASSTTLCGNNQEPDELIQLTTLTEPETKFDIPNQTPIKDESSGLSTETENVAADSVIEEQKPGVVQENSETTICSDKAVVDDSVTQSVISDECQITDQIANDNVPIDSSGSSENTASDVVNENQTSKEILSEETSSKTLCGNNQEPNELTQFTTLTEPEPETPSDIPNQTPINYESSGLSTETENVAADLVIKEKTQAEVVQENPETTICSDKAVVDDSVTQSVISDECQITDQIANDNVPIDSSGSSENTASDVVNENQTSKEILSEETNSTTLCGNKQEPDELTQLTTLTEPETESNIPNQTSINDESTGLSTEIENVVAASVIEEKTQTEVIQENPETTICSDKAVVDDSVTQSRTSDECQIIDQIANDNVTEDSNGSSENTASDVVNENQTSKEILSEETSSKTLCGNNQEPNDLTQLMTLTEPEPETQSDIPNQTSVNDESSGLSTETENVAADLVIEEKTQTEVVQENPETTICSDKAVVDDSVTQSVISDECQITKQTANDNVTVDSNGSSENTASDVANENEASKEILSEETSSKTLCGNNQESNDLTQLTTLTEPEPETETESDIPNQTPINDESSGLSTETENVVADSVIKEKTQTGIIQENPETTICSDKAVVDDPVTQSMISDECQIIDQIANDNVPIDSNGSSENTASDVANENEASKEILSEETSSKTLCGNNQKPNDLTQLTTLTEPEPETETESDIPNQTPIKDESSGLSNETENVVADSVIEEQTQTEVVQENPETTICSDKAVVDDSVTQSVISDECQITDEIANDNVTIDSNGSSENTASDVANENEASKEIILEETSSTTLCGNNQEPDELTQLTTLTEPEPETESDIPNQTPINDESSGLSTETENVAADLVIEEKTQTEVIQENPETTICSDNAVVNDSVTQSMISDECQITDQIANDNVPIDSSGSSKNTASDVANENEASKEILSEETSNTTLCGNNQEPDELSQLTTLTEPEPETESDIPNQTPINDESSSLSNETVNVAADSVIGEKTQTGIIQENPETTICSDKAVVEDSVTQSMISDECQITDQIANDNVPIDSSGISENTASDVANENEASKEIISEETSSTALCGNNQEPNELTQLTTLTEPETESDIPNKASINDECSGLSTETENVAADSVIEEKTQTGIIQENPETTICSDNAVVDDSVTQSMISDECQITDQIANDNVPIDSSGISENTASDVANENEASKEIISEETSSTTLCGNNQEPDELSQLTTLTEPEPETESDIPNQTPINDESSGLSTETENVAADLVIEEKTQTEVVQENPETTICSDNAVVDDSVTQSMISDECQITDQIANDNVPIDSSGSSKNTASDVANENEASKEILSEETSSTTLCGNNQEPDELTQLTTLTEPEPETQSDIPNQTPIKDESSGLSTETENVAADLVIEEKTQTEVVQENPETTICSDKAVVDDSVPQSMISDECQITDQIANDNVPIDSSGSSENTASDVANENQASKEIISEETSSTTLCGNNQEPDELTQLTTLTEPEPETESDIPNQTSINDECSGLSNETENVVADSVIEEKTQTEVVQENPETTICSDNAIVDDSVTQSMISDECQITDQITNDNVPIDSSGSSENTASDVANENEASKEIISEETSSTTLCGNNQEPDELTQLTTLTEPETESDIPNKASINDESSGLSNETENVVAASVIEEKTQTEVVQENPETTVCSDNAVVDDSVTQSRISDECQITDQIANDNVPIDSSGSSKNTASDVANENEASKEIISEETSSTTLCGNNQEPDELSQLTTLTEPEPETETESDIPNQTPINDESSGLSTETENVVADLVIEEKTQTEVVQENPETTICSDNAVVDDSVTQSMISDECQIIDQIANDNVPMDSNCSSENTASDVANENEASEEILSEETSSTTLCGNNQELNELTQLTTLTEPETETESDIPNKTSINDECSGSSTETENVVAGSVIEEKTQTGIIQENPETTICSDKAVVDDSVTQSMISDECQITDQIANDNVPMDSNCSSENTASDVANENEASEEILSEETSSTTLCINNQELNELTQLTTLTEPETEVDIPNKTSINDECSGSSPETENVVAGSVIEEKTQTGIIQENPETTICSDKAVVDDSVTQSVISDECQITDQIANDNVPIDSSGISENTASDVVNENQASKEIISEETSSTALCGNNQEPDELTQHTILTKIDRSRETETANVLNTIRCTNVEETFKNLPKDNISLKLEKESQKLSEKSVIEEDVIRTLPSVKALAKAFLIASNKCSSNEKTPIAKRNTIHGLWKRPKSSIPKEIETVIDNSDIEKGSTLKNLSSKNEKSRSEIVMESTVPSGQSVLTPDRSVILKDNIEFFENLKFN